MASARFLVTSLKKQLPWGRSGPSRYNDCAVTTYRIQVLDRAFHILDVIAESEDGFGLPDVAERTQLHKSTAHRLLMVLESARFVERDAVSGNYRLGSRVMELGLSAAAHLDVYKVARPHLQTLMEETGETAHLAVLRDREVVTLMTVESRQTLRAPRAAGARTPAYCTSLGKAMLAYLQPRELDDYVNDTAFQAFTPKTGITAERFQSEIRATRRRGYAIDDEEWELGLRCLAAPVRDGGSGVIAAIGISGPVFRIGRKRLPLLARAVTSTAANISEALGFTAARADSNGRVAQTRNAR